VMLISLALLSIHSLVITVLIWIVFFTTTISGMVYIYLWGKRAFFHLRKE